MSTAKRGRLQQPPQNRSLERGVEILRAFRPGASLLGNGELAERTGLSRATVSRLTQTLVGTGLLDYDRGRRAYRLAAPVLSLAHAMRSGSPVLQAVSPMMRVVAEKKKINVGLAIADREEMVYLESVRYNRKPTLRNVVAGQRVPIELTSLGRAYLAAAPDEQRHALMAHFKSRRTGGWRELERQILAAIENVRQRGYCVACWQPEVVALATPIVADGHPVYVLNFSVSTQAASAAVESELAPGLLALAVSMRRMIEAM
ncbi:transcriptional regulator, IclR family [Noviherbaspirillum humi]|uniref:Transcriptional regulator, IclR family n=1 Tax=Noviherbaspirillum humi TaxID=1688639 RepID=A0A239IVW8_9BURK|nr:IclR family transcriptional regulator [Noviherbaspirillum humi]SNS96564.1 transcriptional regulator, IclR family [Noviherbaspirillum humi]